ncbi:SH3 domain-containing protein [Lachnospiraceae bacterium MD335]|nr:SH3 domain-containing protein [Lachnospiraceae bacterium MD335]
MTNKKLFKSAVVITAVMLSVSGYAGGCSKQAEPVIADATVETPEPEESIESVESTEPTPSPTVEPTQESIDDTVSSESEDNIESEENTINKENIQSEEVEPDLGYTITPIDEVTMYATTNANLRSGPGTDYDKVGSLTYAQEIVCNGKVADGDKEWLVLKTEDGSIQMVSAKLVSRTKPQPQSSSGSSSSGGGSSTQQPSGEGQPSSSGSGGNGGSGGGQPSGGDPGSVGMGEAGGMFSGLPESGAGGIDYSAPELNFE